MITGESFSLQLSMSFNKIFTRFINYCLLLIVAINFILFIKNPNIISRSANYSNRLYENVLYDSGYN